LVDPVQNSGEGLGIAPIGHKVTVSSPTEFAVNINCSITIKSGYTLENIKSEINEQLQNYIRSVQMDWFNETTLTIFMSRVSATILQVEGVVNVSNLTINSGTSDISLNPLEDNNLYPILNEVVINED
jgi:uncharacterized phage protein gp47/JayE